MPSRKRSAHINADYSTVNLHPRLASLRVTAPSTHASSRTSSAASLGLAQPATPTSSSAGHNSATHAQRRQDQPERPRASTARARAARPRPGKGVASNNQSMVPGPSRHLT